MPLTKRMHGKAIFLNHRFDIENSIKQLIYSYTSCPQKAVDKKMITKTSDGTIGMEKRTNNVKIILYIVNSCNDKTQTCSGTPFPRNYCSLNKKDLFQT